MYELKSGKPVEMVGGYDAFATGPTRIYPGGTSHQRWHKGIVAARDGTPLLRLPFYDLHPYEEDR